MLAWMVLVWTPAGWAQQKPAATPPPPEVEVMTVVQKDLPVFKEWVAAIDGLDTGTRIGPDPDRITF